MSLLQVFHKHDIMHSMKNTAKHPKISHGRTGVLIVNLGTPEATDYFSMRRYLKQFLSDPRVVEKNRAVWWCVLNIILLSFIPFRSAKNYRKIWNTEKDESPLRTITRGTAEKLADKFKNPFGDSVEVEWAMRYGTPSIESKLNTLKEKGCTRLVILPFYPQYSAVTTASVCDDLFDACKKMRWMPSLRIIEPYFDHPAYIDALATSITQHTKDTDSFDQILLSYHGLPKANLTKGDPYHCHCHKTTRLLAEKLGWKEGNFRTTFQSRFGREEWLKPYTDETLESLPKEGMKNILTLSPGFAADCVETLEEMAITNAEIFQEAGGEKYDFVPCLNDSDLAIKLYAQLIEENLHGWEATTSSKEEAA